MQTEWAERAHCPHEGCRFETEIGGPRASAGVIAFEVARRLARHMREHEQKAPV